MEDLLIQLHLDNHFPQKLTLFHALVIREDTLEVSKKHQVSKDDTEGGDE